MSIAEFIRDSVLRSRLKEAGCLVMYDADRRYREQCFDLVADKVRVVDASESSINSREAALLALREVGQPKAPLEGLLIYVPTKRPETDEQKQQTPSRCMRNAAQCFRETMATSSEPLSARPAGSRYRDPQGVCGITRGADICGDRCNRWRCQLAPAAGDLASRIRPRDFGCATGAE